MKVLLDIELSCNGNIITHFVVSNHSIYLISILKVYEDASEIV